MTTIKDLLRTKGSAYWAVKPESTVYDALKLMADKNIGAVLVMENNIIVGILSERDYARKIIIKGKSSKETVVSEIMTEKVFYVTSDMSVEAALALMTEKHFRHLPVVDNNKVSGVISIGDIVKTIISDQKNTIEQLEQYVMGSK
jgi:CBS domain-containing protein